MPIKASRATAAKKRTSVRKSVKSDIRKKASTQKRTTTVKKPSKSIAKKRKPVVARSKRNTSQHSKKAVIFLLFWKGAFVCGLLLLLRGQDTLQALAERPEIRLMRIVGSLLLPDEVLFESPVFNSQERKQSPDQFEDVVQVYRRSMPSAQKYVTSVVSKLSIQSSGQHDVNNVNTQKSVSQQKNQPQAIASVSVKQNAKVKQSAVVVASAKTTGNISSTELRRGVSSYTYRSTTVGSVGGGSSSVASTSSQPVTSTTSSSSSSSAAQQVSSATTSVATPQEELAVHYVNGVPTIAKVEVTMPDAPEFPVRLINAMEDLLAYMRERETSLEQRIGNSISQDVLTKMDNISQNIDAGNTINISFGDNSNNNSVSVNSTVNASGNQDVNGNANGNANQNNNDDTNGTGSGSGTTGSGASAQGSSSSTPADPCLAADAAQNPSCTGSGTGAGGSVDTDPNQNSAQGDSADVDSAADGTVENDADVSIDADVDIQSNAGMERGIDMPEMPAIDDDQFDVEL